MLPLVVCTCGLSLGNIAPVYRIIASKRMAAMHGESNPHGDPDSRMSSAWTPLDPAQVANVMSDMLAVLHISGCCAIRLITSLDFRRHY